MWYTRQSSTKLQRPCQTRVLTATRWRRGNSRLNNFFYRHFFLGNQGQVFLFLHLIANLIYALYWNTHCKIIQGTQSGRFFTQLLRPVPQLWQPRWIFQVGFKQTTCTAPKTNKDPKCQKGPY